MGAQSLGHKENQGKSVRVRKSTGLSEMKKMNLPLWTCLLLLKVLHIYKQMNQMASDYKGMQTQQNKTKTLYENDVFQVCCLPLLLQHYMWEEQMIFQKTNTLTVGIFYMVFYLRKFMNSFE